MQYDASTGSRSGDGALVINSERGLFRQTGDSSGRRGRGLAVEIEPIECMVRKEVRTTVNAFKGTRPPTIPVSGLDAGFNSVSVAVAVETLSLWLSVLYVLRKSSPGRSVVSVIVVV